MRVLKKMSTEAFEWTGYYQKVADRHSDLYLQYTETHNTISKDDLDALESELPNLLAGIDTAAERKHWPQVQSYMSVLSDVLDLRGHWATYEHYLEQAMKASRVVGDRWQEAVYTGNLAILREELGQPEAARRQHRAVQQIFVELEDWRQVAIAHHRLGLVSRILGEYAQAQEECEAGLAIFEREQDN